MSQANRRRLITFAKGLGYEVRHTGRGHLQFRHKTTGSVVYAAHTPKGGFEPAYRQLVSMIDRPCRHC